MEESKNKTKDILIIAGLVVAVLVIAYFMAYFEVIRRAHREYNEGEKFLSFHKDPNAKKAFYDEKLRKKEITDIEYQMLMEDNALKNAYVQYQTVVDLFTPPESQWVKKSRERLTEIAPEYNAWVAQLSAEVEKASKTPIVRPK